MAALPNRHYSGHLRATEKEEDLRMSGKKISRFLTAVFK